MVDKNEFKLQYALALFGSEIDEDGAYYIDVYKHELESVYKTIIEDSLFVLDYLTSYSDLYTYYKALLISNARTFYNSAFDIRTGDIDKLAFNMSWYGLE